MKKTLLFMTGVFLLLAVVETNAQTISGADYFIGKWDILTEGGPSGETQIIVDLERKEGKLEGKIKIADQEEVKSSKIEEKENSLTISFTSTHAYDIKLNLEKKDDNHIIGVMTIIDLGPLNFSGSRVVN